MPLSSTHLYVSAAHVTPAARAMSRPINGFMALPGRKQTVGAETAAVGEDSIRGLTLLGCGSRCNHVAVAVGLHRGNETRPLHLLDQPGRPVVADAQMSLYQRNRCAP